MTKTLTLTSLAFAVAALAAQNVNPPAVVVPAASEPRVDPVRDPARPALIIVGDSTVKNHGAGEGWGDYLAPFFDDVASSSRELGDGRTQQSQLHRGGPLGPVARAVRRATLS